MDVDGCAPPPTPRLPLVLAISLDNLTREKWRKGGSPGRFCAKDAPEESSISVIELSRGVFSADDVEKFPEKLLRGWGGRLEIRESGWST